MIRGSIRARLTLWHTVALAAVVLAFAAGTYAFLVRSAAQRVDQSLAESARYFVAAWADELAEDSTAVAQGAAAAVREFRYRDRRILVYDAGGALVAASDSNPLIPAFRPADFHQLARSPLAGLARGASPGLPASATLGSDDAWVRAMAMRVALSGQPFTVVALSSMRNEVEVRETYADALLVAIPLALALAGLVGYALAHASLAPVSEITALAERIGERDLDQRLPVPNPHDELGRLATVLNDLLGRLQYAFAQQRQFMADASHELRTPVAAFRSAADVALARPTRPEEEYRETLAIVSGEGRRLSRIVDDLFLLARADAGEQRVHKQPLYLEELLADCARSARALGAARDVRVDFSPADEAPLDGDAALLARLVMNLLHNAVKHSPAGGQVRLTLARESATDAYRIGVRDSGRGVAAEARPHIFDRFYRADTARGRSSPLSDEADESASGAGLGLAIARWVAEAHGGTVTLEDSGETGSLFVIRLPSGVEPVADETVASR